MVGQSGHSRKRNGISKENNCYLQIILLLIIVLLFHTLVDSIILLPVFISTDVVALLICALKPRGTICLC